MSLFCNIDMCKRKCCVLCYCCNKNLCFNHLQEHRNLIESQLNPLINEINRINDQLTSLAHSYEENNDIVDEYLVRRIDQLRHVVIQLRSTISELIYQQDTTNEDIILLTSTIRSLQQAIETIKQTKSSADLPPFITKRILPIEQSRTKDLDLSTLSSPFQTVICQNPLGSALATNNQRLLMDQRLNLHLFDQDLILKKQYRWNNGLIRDICWSSILKSFIFITNNQRFYLANDNLTSIEHIQNVPEEDWSSCTCSDESLFVTTNHQGTNIFQFNLFPIFELIQQWKSPLSCQEHELISDIVYDNQTLAFTVEDSFSNVVHLQLRSSKTLNLIWSFRSDIQYHLYQPAIRCCSLKYNQWLVIDSNTSRLFHIDSDGKMKSSHIYKSPPWNAILHDSNTLIIRTETSLHFHQIY